MARRRWKNRRKYRVQKIIKTNPFRVLDDRNRYSRKENRRQVASLRKIPRGKTGITRSGKGYSFFEQSFKKDRRLIRILKPCEAERLKIRRAYFSFRSSTPPRRSKGGTGRFDLPIRCR